jgi:outer membrane immunogenic protein
MKKVLFAAVGMIASGVALGVAPALAADLPARTYTKAPAIVPPLVYDWSGFYVGINAGGGWSRDCSTNQSLLGFPTALVATTFLGGTSILNEGCNNASGGTVGGQVGYRWQSANWVFGVEAQGNWADFTGSNVNQLVALFAGPVFVDRSKVDAFGMLTGQVGYAWNNVLWYVKGGAAVTDNQYTGLAFGTVFDTANQTRWGGAVGTGVEIGFAPNWSVAFEYDHLFMGTQNVNYSVLGFPDRTDSVKQDVDLGTVRLNYRFGGPVVARY